MSPEEREAWRCVSLAQRGALTSNGVIEAINEALALAEARK